MKVIKTVIVDTSNAEELESTVVGMLSSDYKERFKAEYKQLMIRKDKLNEILAKEKAKILEFDLACDKEILEAQLLYMSGYASVLRDRAAIEGIKLD